MCQILHDQPRGLVVRASGYKSRGSGFDSRIYHGDFPCGGRIPVVTMVWVASRIRFKVETSLTRSHTSINSWLNPRQRSPRWRGPHHERQPAHQLIEYTSTLIADYGREKKKYFLRISTSLYFFTLCIQLTHNGENMSVPTFHFPVNLLVLCLDFLP